MRLPDSAHASQPWRIHEIAPDFGLEDVWQVPGTGRPEDFSRLVQRMARSDPSRNPSLPVRALFEIRWRIGKLLGWDGPDTGLASRVPTLRDRLPPDLRDGPPGPSFQALPFTPVYLTEDEFAAEVANATMHGVMHIGRIRLLSGGFSVQMAVLVKPNGARGKAYMAAIKPFRRLLVYPAMLRGIERELRR
jgi:hypothetical protein